MEQRIEFGLKAMGASNFRALCQEYGISTKTGYKWKERFLREGMGGMVERSRRPHHHADQLGDEVVCEIVGLKLAHGSWGPRKIRELYRRRHGIVASESSFKRILERAGLVEKRRRRRAKEAGRLNSGRRAAAPNQVWTVDFKGWWRSHGKRCEPLTVRDEHSRYILELRALENGRSETVRKSFEQLFERQGLPQAIRSDNGAPFASINGLLGLSRLSAWWIALGIDLERGRPAHPQDNGAHERMHLDISREIEAMGRSDQAALDLWRHSFNYERPHDALSLAHAGRIVSRLAEKIQRDTGRSGISQHVHAQGKPAWNDQNGCSAAFPHYGASRMECRAQASRSRSAGSVVRPAPAWPGGLDHKQFYSSGSPLEQRCKKWRLSTRIKLQIETYSVKIYQQSVTDVLS